MKNQGAVINIWLKILHVSIIHSSFKKYVIESIPYIVKEKYPKYRYVLRHSLSWENPQFAQTTPLSVGILLPIIRPDLNQQKGITRAH